MTDKSKRNETQSLNKTNKKDVLVLKLRNYHSLGWSFSSLFDRLTSQNNHFKYETKTNSLCPFNGISTEQDIKAYFRLGLPQTFQFDTNLNFATSFYYS